MCTDHAVANNFFNETRVDKASSTLSRAEFFKQYNAGIGGGIDYPLRDELPRGKVWHWNEEERRFECVNVYARSVRHPFICVKCGRITMLTQTFSLAECVEEYGIANVRCCMPTLGVNSTECRGDLRLPRNSQEVIAAVKTIFLRTGPRKFSNTDRNTDRDTGYEDE